MKNKTIYFFATFLIALCQLSYGQVIYQHNFGTATFTAVNPYGVAPTTIDANLSGSQWLTSFASGYNSSAGFAGQALSLTSSAGAPTYSLSFTVGSGFNCDITAFSFWRQRSAAGAQNWTLTVNGVTTIGSGTVPTVGATTGTLGVSSTANGLSGVVNVVLQLGGATGAGTFRLDDFTLYGSVYAASTCTPPTIQASVISSTSITNTSATVNWTAGNGGNVIVVAHQSSPVNAFPASGSTYIANNFFGNGQDLGGGNFVVYNGTGTSVNLTGLFSGSTYYFAVMEYNTSGGNCYLFPPTTGNLTTTGTLSNCIDIESILVDACVPGGGCLSAASPNCNCEGKNEMVRFKIGPAPINVSDISINWPSNSYLGIETNTTVTTPLVNALNSAITACGYLKQPIGGILPAGKDVLLMTSTDFCTTANSFANLNDTLYLIFQVAGNFSGHFGNTTNGGAVSSVPTGSISPRTLSISQISTGCVESVVYERSLLVNIFGTYNGTTAQNDGSAVDYDAAGNPTYVNRGCVAPFIPFQVDAGIDGNVCFNSSTVLTATTANVYTSIAWSGGAGTFSSPSALTTTYTPGVAETGTVMLYCSMTQSCSATLGTTKDSVMLTILQLPLATITASNGYSLCPSATSVMSFSVANPAFASTVNPTWSTPSSTNSTYTISSPSGTASVTYTLNLTNACGNTPQTFTVYPLALPTVSLSASSLTACAGNTVALSANSNSGNYSWTNPVSTNSAVVVSANTTTIGVVTTTNTCGSDSKTYTLTITPIPTISVDNANVSLCSGQSATVTATSNTGTYTWSPGSTTTNTISFNTAGIYTVTTSDVCGSASATVDVTVNSVPTLSLVSSSPSLCASGQTSTLTLSGSVGTYSWSNGATTSTTSISAPGIYTATVTTPSCGSATASINIGTLPLPTISISVPSTTVCSGSSLTFTANSSDANYLWTGGATTQTISVSSSSVVVTTTNTCGSAQASQTLTIIAQPTVTVSSSNVNLCTGQSATVTATSNAGTYTWSPGSINTNTIAISSAGVYTVQSSNSCGTSLETLTVSISSAPTLSVVSSDVTICASGQTATLSLNGSSGTYSWSTGSSSPTTTITSPGVYSATVVTPGCGTAVANISLGTAPLPVVSIQTPPSSSLCVGGSVVLTANSNEGNYLWPGGISTNTFSATSSPVVVTSTNACGSSQASQTLSIIPLPTVTLSVHTVTLCAGQSATVQANTNTGVTYTWSTGASTSSVSLNTGGPFIAYVSNSCGTASDTVVVTIGASPSVTATATQTLLCSGQTATLSLTGSTGTYLWNDGATTATTSASNSGVYTVTLTNSCGQATSSVSITALQNPTVTISASSNTICAGQSTTLTAISGNAGNYNWSNGDVTNISVVNTSGVNTVTVSNACGIATASININFAIFPVININPSSVLICPNETATLTAIGGASPYVWSNSSSTGSVVTTTGGTITVSSTNACGTGSASVVVNVTNLNASIIANPTIGTVPAVVSFTNNSSGASTYLWDFGNGNIANTQSVTPQTYTVVGNYIVYLTVTNGVCMDVDSVTIKVLNEDPILIIPNVFTPNGDSVNDIFKVSSKNIVEFSCTIFDRWGLQMYYWNDLRGGWNGKTNDKEVPAGTYFYIINAKDIDGVEIKKQGAVALFK